VEIARLTLSKNFVGKREKFIFYAFADLKQMQRFENGSDLCGFRSLDNSTSNRVLDRCSHKRSGAKTSDYLARMHVPRPTNRQRPDIL